MRATLMEWEAQQLTPDERLERPRYSYAEADRIAGVTRGTCKRWTRGYSYQANGAPIAAAPVTPGIERIDEPGASFFDLIEVAAIGRLKDVGWSLPVIRNAVESCQVMFNLYRPLVTERFKTDGRDFFVQRDDVLIELGIGRHKGEQAWDQVLAPFLDTVAYEGEFARRWWPQGRDQRVVVDPDYGFGLPVIAGSGVRTEIIHEQMQGNVPRERIAREFNITPEEVGYAIQFEDSRTQA